ncbi:hypothetical protein L3X38_028021 [Prunus dulcis]|uniref:Uncharacterized protein n=1 Tax=Prunus dulcis TaxID=3755 RepID=A0AAD4VQK3_PRUDU|nr:hypothetical protein L3X38_028021 [Prunus dulcis]
MLSKANLDVGYALRKEEVLKLIGHIYGKVGNPIDLGQVAFFTVINTIMRMLWGETLEAEKGADLGAELRNVMSEIMELLGKANVSDFLMLKNGVPQVLDLRKLLNWGLALSSVVTSRDRLRRSTILSVLGPPLAITVLFLGAHEQLPSGSPILGLL